MSPMVCTSILEKWNRKMDSLAFLANYDSQNIPQIFPFLGSSDLHFSVNIFLVLLFNPLEKNLQLVL